MCAMVLVSPNTAAYESYKEGIFPLAVPNVNDANTTNKDVTGMTLRLKGLGKRCPVTLKSTACGKAMSNATQTMKSSSSAKTSLKAN